MLSGLIELPWWGYVVVTLIFTHITIAGVTIFLHRCQAHRALDLHPIVSHLFRFWLWLTTGMVTKEWAAIHRKHHAKCETPEDPHSPIIEGINKVLWDGVDLYRKESRVPETMERYGQGTPDDWLERNLYAKHSAKGIRLMLVIDLILFGPLGLTIWAIQMVWIPFWAAGMINGVGHYWGYRNFEVADASTNISPWGIIVGGEEMHNNHHTYPSSAKFSIKWWEFDIGWLYISIMKMFGLANVKKIAPKPIFDQSKTLCDMETVKAVIHNRFQIMSRFAKDVLKNVHKEEVRKAADKDPEQWAAIKKARRLLIRDINRLDKASHERLAQILDSNQTLKTVYDMKEKLQDIWQRSATNQENLLRALEDWCHQAEETGIQALREFSQKLRTYSVSPMPA